MQTYVYQVLSKLYRRHMSGSIEQPIPASPSVGQSSVMALIRYLIKQGSNTQQIRHRVGISLAALENQDARLPLNQYLKLWQFALEQAKDPALGLRLGAQQNLSEMGIVGHVVLNSENLRAGLEEYIRLFDVVNDAICLDLSSDERHGYLTFIHKYPEYYCIPDMERSLVLALQRSRAWLGKDLQLTSVHFPHKAPAYDHLYQRVFSCPVYFNQSECRIVFAQDHFNLRPTRSNPYLKQAALEYANNLLQRFSFQSLSEQVKTLIYRDIDKSEPSINKVAACLNMSKQTLYRKLKLEGLFFQKLVEKVRFDKARQLLRLSALSTSEIALQLGFSELSAFSRAFKRWSGMSPKAFRQNIPNS